MTYRTGQLFSPIRDRAAQKASVNHIGILINSIELLRVVAVLIGWFLRVRAVFAR
jgi:hypothetical protein